MPVETHCMCRPCTTALRASSTIQNKRRHLQGVSIMIMPNAHTETLRLQIHDSSHNTICVRLQ